jgi:hypothetical protein
MRSAGQVHGGAGGRVREPQGARRPRGRLPRRRVPPRLHILRERARESARESAVSSTPPPRTPPTHPPDPTAAATGRAPHGRRPSGTAELDRAIGALALSCPSLPPSLPASPRGGKAARPAAVRVVRVVRVVRRLEPPYALRAPSCRAPAAPARPPLGLLPRLLPSRIVRSVAGPWSPSELERFVPDSDRRLGRRPGSRGALWPGLPGARCWAARRCGLGWRRLDSRGPRLVTRLLGLLHGDLQPARVNVRERFEL